MGSNTLLHKYTESDNLAQVLSALLSRTFNAGGFAIKTASSADAKTANTIEFTVNGVHKTKAAVATVSLSSVAASTCATGASRLYVIFLDASGNVTVQASDAGTTTMPAYSMATLCPVAAVKVVNASGSTFTPGTTALDTASITFTFMDLSGVFPGQTL